MLRIYNPFSQNLIAERNFHSPEEAENKIQLAYATFKDPSKYLSKNKKLDILTNFANLLETHKEALIQLAIAEGGKPLQDTIVELNRAIQGVLIAMDCMHKNEGSVIPMGLSASSQRHVAYTKLEPLGLVLGICAFNHPVNLVIHQIIPSLVAGCPVILKPALKTPLCAERLVQLLHEAGCPEAWCQILITEDALTEKLVSDSRWAFMSFIGSGTIGWQLRSKLAPGAACTLEHGGIAPLIVTESVDIQKSIPRIVKGAFYHAGQVCVSTQRLYIPTHLKDSILNPLLEATKKIIVGDPTHPDTFVGPIISSQALQRIDAVVQEAITEGATILCGGHTVQDTCYAPTILLNPSDKSRISTEEIFGPVLAVYTYDTLNEAITRANDVPYCFQAAVMGDDPEVTHTVADQLKARAVMINDHTAFRVDWMPFGGAELSGIGTGGIPYGIKELQCEKLYVVNYN